MTHMDSTPVARLARWFSARQDRPHECEYNGRSEPSCENLVTLRASRADGHERYCSAYHSALAQEDAPM